MKIRDIVKGVRKIREILDDVRDGETVLIKIKNTPITIDIGKCVDFAEKWVSYERKKN